MKIYTKTHPKGFKSPALKNTLRNLGELPYKLGQVGSAITGEIKKNLSGKILHRRSGKLYESWEWEIDKTTHGWRLLISSDVAYSRIHNFGGFTGRNHATRIKKTRYVDRAVIAKKKQVKTILQNWVGSITRR